VKGRAWRIGLKLGKVGHLTQTFNTTGEIVDSISNWVIEYPKEVVIGGIVTTVFFFGGELVTAGGTLLAHLASLFVIFYRSFLC
jgi:hypothetical protein